MKNKKSLSTAMRAVVVSSMALAVGVSAGGLSLVLSPAPSAMAAYAVVDDTFTVTGTTTADELNLALKESRYTNFNFTADVTFDKTIAVPANGREVTFNIPQWATVTFAPAKGAGLKVTGAQLFKINSTGTVHFGDVPSGYGFQISGTSNVELDGGKYEFAGIHNYNIDSQLQKGTFVVNNATMNFDVPDTNVEGALIFGKGVSQVRFSNTKITVDDKSSKVSKRGGFFSPSKSVWAPFFYSESPNNEFVNGTKLDAISHDYYGMSFVGSADNGQKITVDSSKIKVVIAEDARGASLFGIPSHAAVGINSKNSNFVISSQDGRDSLVEIEDNSNRSNFSAQKAIEFQNATYKVENGKLIAPSAGRDAKEGQNGNSKLWAGENAVVNIGNENPWPEQVKIVVDGGSVKLPENVKTGQDGNQGAVLVTNSAGDELAMFVVEKDVTEFTYLEGDGTEHNYKVSQADPDNKRYVWAIPVKVEFYDSKEKADAGDEKLSADTVVNGTKLEDAVNSKSTPAIDENEVWVWNVNGVEKEYDPATDILSAEIANGTGGVIKIWKKKTTADAGTQTDPVDPGTDAGTQTDPVDPGTDGGTQTDPVDPGTDAGTQTDPVDPGTDGGTQTDPETKPEVKPVVKPETKPEVKPVVKPETKPEVKPVVKPETKPEVKPVVKPETKPEVKPVVKPETKPEVKPVVKPETKPEAKDDGGLAKTGTAALYAAGIAMLLAGLGAGSLAIRRRLL
ncbi:hypothetical protein KRX54_01030 [Actinomycetaceae bacterium TAE3-ERU4]|nr:hypothetical protein [Actinomycetaceae bacterium TAE3-ERU4]